MTLDPTMSDERSQAKAAISESREAAVKAFVAERDRNPEATGDEPAKAASDAGVEVALSWVESALDDAQYADDPLALVRSFVEAMTVEARSR